MKPYGHKETRGMAKWLLLFCLLVSLPLVSSCDRLSDDDDMVAEVLPGTWAFSYELQSEEDPGLYFSYDHVIFRTDGTVSITYPDGSMEGTYRAGGDVIRIEGRLDNGDEQLMLWRIIAFSAQQLTAEYDFEFGGQRIKALVTLDRTDALAYSSSTSALRKTVS